MEITCVDTSVLIDHYRATDKASMFLFRATSAHALHVPSIVQYEVLRGNAVKDAFWMAYFCHHVIFDELCAREAANIYATLKRTNKLIGAENILIAAVAIANKALLLTLNAKHFSRIENLTIITPEQLGA